MNRISSQVLTTLYLLKESRQAGFDSIYPPFAGLSIPAAYPRRTRGVPDGYIVVTMGLAYN